jgi:cell division protein FtsB
MATRLKKPSVLKQLALSVLLTGFLAYLGANTVGGQFGLVGREEMRNDITEFEAQSAVLQAEIDAIAHRLTLLDPAALDPDLLTERAHALLSMAHPEDTILLPESD